MDRKEIKKFFRLGNKEIIKEGIDKINLTDEEKRNSKTFNKRRKR